MASRSKLLRSAELPAVVLFNRVVAPLIAVVSLFVTARLYWGRLDEEWLLLATIAFLVSSQAFAELNLLRLSDRNRLGVDVRKLIIAWGIVVAVLLFLGYATKMSAIFSRRVLLTWMIIAPAAVLVSLLLFRAMMRRTKLGATGRSAVIVGAGELGDELAARFGEQSFVPVHLSGFFDDRNVFRLPPATRSRLTGTLDDLPDYVRENKINNIYITLPMVAQPRTMKLLDELQDTTASIYFVPDIGRFNLVHTHLDEVGDMPVIAVSDTPFTGTNALIKRTFDILVASALLILLSPLLLAIAWGVRRSSPGPVIFRQRRYGLDGDEFWVCKFRTMSVCEDGPVVEQAKRGDPRMTRFGAFLRKTSLDELPQLFNVLQGRMSIVGPRPHAVAHNEMYRKLIKGYMLRHKVRPGITGWAQVNGLRGETQSVDKMAARVKYDIDYIRNWSVFMDVQIMLRTLALVYRDRAAH
jgi:putative colanic acid biosysnthesis UDP-glucose lipid carrier transferase